MRIEVISASRREQPAEDVVAAVYLIRRDEIRRSGPTSVPELLRLAPGVQVARINSNTWADSDRRGVDAGPSPRRTSIGVAIRTRAIPCELV
jgi:outer membrane receptor protein involved in Fe transport